MSNESTLILTGNLTADPELRFTSTGRAVANFTVASTPRNFDRTSNEYKDGATTFLRCTVWQQTAENVAESLRKGDRVLLTGRLAQRDFETKEGEKRSVIELEVEEIGAALRYATAKPVKATRNRSTDETPSS